MTQKLYNKQFIIITLFFILFFMIICRLVDLQIINGEEYYTKCLVELINKEKKEYSETMAVINFMLYKKWWPSEIFEKSSELIFNGRYFKVPYDFEKYLTITYGDYMTLPPEEKRVSNHLFDAYWKEDGDIQSIEC